MSFTQTTLAKTSSGFAHIISGGNWTYTSTTDALATIEVDGYFDTIAALLSIGEVFQVKDSTPEVELLEVDIINPTAPRVIMKKFVGGGSIADGAVTTPKLADIAVTTIKIATAAVSLTKLDAGIAPSHVIKFSETRTTVGGAATENFTFTGALASDLVHTQLIVEGAVPRTILVASMLSPDTAAVEFSGDPAADHILLITILRAAS